MADRKAGPRIPAACCCSSPLATLLGGERSRGRLPTLGHSAQVIPFAIFWQQPDRRWRQPFAGPPKRTAAHAFVATHWRFLSAPFRSPAVPVRVALEPHWMFAAP